MEINAEFPGKLGILFQPARYKVLYGGRGSGKSWGVARALLIEGLKRPLRILCAREIQNSIEESVHELLSSQIVDLGLISKYEIQKTVIRGSNGTEFFFAGLRHNVNKIKSTEAVDICWVEEAHAVGKHSWTTLIPTVRKLSSEIWITFNPDLETDETYQRFVKNTPPNTLIAEVNWRDNPWFPEVLENERRYMAEQDPDEYLTVWEGKCRQMLVGAVYAKELRTATLENRLTKVPYEQGVPVDTFWDIGRSDYTSIWFGQKVGFEYRIIDFYQNSQYSLEHYINVLQGRKYRYGTWWLPHDARAKQLGSKLSVEEQLREVTEVRIVPRLSPEDGINAARTRLANCYFDEDKCAEGLNSLRHYRYEVLRQNGQETGTFSRKPKHDWSSHASDAFRYLAIALKEPRKAKKSLLAEYMKTAAEPFAEAWGGSGWLR